MTSLHFKGPDATDYTQVSFTPDLEKLGIDGLVEIKGKTSQKKHTKNIDNTVATILLTCLKVSEVYT